MRLKNTTDYPDYFLRRMVSWCCKELDLPARAVKDATFRNRRTSPLSGRAWPWRGRIVVSVMAGEPTEPVSWGHRFGIEKVYVDRMEILLSVAAHELCHLRQYVDRGGSRFDVKYRERECDKWAELVLDKFRDQRESLCAEWSVPPRQRSVKPSLTVAEKREVNVRKQLAAWESKQRRAKNRVVYWRKKARYYDRVAAKRVEKAKPE